MKMDRTAIITRNLAEVVGIEELKNASKIYWGTAPTGKPHLGYFVPIMKIADFLLAECKVVILFADLHAVLEGKTNLEVLEARCDYYEVIIKAMLTEIGIDVSKLTFIRGRSFQLSEQYTTDVYKLMMMVSVDQAKKAGSEVVKIEKNPTLGKIVYPLLQCLDEEYLHVDAQFGGIDQRKIFMFARENLPKLGYKKRIHLMNPLIPGLGKSGKMSSSEPDSKIDFDDCDDTIMHKLKNAFSVDGQCQNNCLLMIAKYIVFPFLVLREMPFVLMREEKYGGSKEYQHIDDLERDFSDKTLGSLDLKMNLAREIIKIITPIRQLIEDEYKDLSEKAYS